MNNIDSFMELFKAIAKPLDTVGVHALSSTLQYMETVCSEEFGFKKGESDEYKLRYVVLAFIFASAWGFSGCLQEKEAEKMNALIMKKFPTFNFPNEPIINCLIGMDDLELKPYSDVINNYPIEQNVPFWELLIPTVDFVKLQSMALHLINSKRNVLLAGSSGTGKSLLA